MLHHLIEIFKVDLRISSELNALLVISERVQNRKPYLIHNY